MSRLVEVRYIAGDLAELKAEMRAWLDHNQIEAQEFHHSSGCPGHAFRVGFRAEDDAAAFAQAFCGWVVGNDPQGAALWTAPSMAGPNRVPSQPTPQVLASTGNGNSQRYG